MLRFQNIPRIEARAALLSLATGIVLLAIKFTAYYLTGSSAIFSDALENIVNVMAAGFALYSLSVAHAPADQEHPYGHGKIEFVSAGFEGGMILIVSVIIVLQTIFTLIKQHGPSVTEVGNGLMLILTAMAGNWIVGLYLIRIGRRERSLTLEADGKHLISDALSSAAAVVALLLIKFLKWHWADPIAAILISLYVARIGIVLIRRSIAGLMDEQDVEDERLLKEILNAHTGPHGKPPLICSYHKLRHRHSGRYHWVDFHIVVPGSLSVEKGHEIASAIEYELEQALGVGNATAHIEPCVEGNCPTCEPEAQPSMG